MTGAEGAEMTLNQFVESKWFKLLARGCMVLLLPAVISLGSYILVLVNDVSNVQETQAARAVDNDRFQAAIIGDVTEVKEGVALVQSDVSSVKLDIALMRGVLQEMQRRDLAQANARPWAGMLGSAPAPPN